MVEYWIKNGSKNLQNCNAKLIEQKSIFQKCENKSHKCTLGMFERHLQSGEPVNHSWLCFSLSKGSVHCYVCKPMTTSRSLLAHGGFSDWKHASTRLANHEKSEEHHQSVLSLARRSLEIGLVDHGLTQQAKQIERY